MKYKIGDKFLQEIEIQQIIDPLKFGKQYVMSGLRYANDDDLDKLRRPDDITAQEAWEIARKIGTPVCYAGFPCEELGEIFGTTSICNIFEENTPHQAKAKIEAWEAEKEIKVGDVISSYSRKAVVLNIHDNYFDVLAEDGSAEEWYKNKIIKTGRHIDIQSVLEQIGGG